MTMYPGKVVQLDPAGPLVQVPLLAHHVPFGPIESAQADLAVGDRVLVSSIGNTRDQLMVVGRIPGRAPTIAEIPGLTTSLETINDRIDTVRLDQQTDRGVLGEHDDRLDSLEGRTSAVESVNATQNGRLAALESGASGYATGAQLTQLRADTAGRVTTKGDLLLGIGAGALARRAVGANNQMLIADSAQADGVRWADQPRGLPLGLTGATAPTRYVGATAQGAPTTGTFAVGDFVIDGSGVLWWCTTAGTPGTWTNAALTTPMGHCGSTSGFQPIGGSPGGVPMPDGAYVTFATAQVLRGGMTFGGNGLTVPKAGAYRVSAKGYFTGGVNYQGLVMVTRNSTALPPSTSLINVFTPKTDAADYSGFASAICSLAAGDTLRLWMKSPNSTWGSDGYNGSYLEVEYLDQ